MALKRRPYPKARVGLFAVGLDTYWKQFPGLKKQLEGYTRAIARQLTDLAELVDLGMVDSASKAQVAGTKFAGANLDLLICHTATYATGSQVLPVVQAAKVPVLVLNLQPMAAMDYENTDTGKWLAACSACCVPEISNTFARSNIDFHVVSGMVTGDERAWTIIRDWVAAARASRVLKGARFGMLGHTYPGMLDMVTDYTTHSARWGLHTEILEMCDLQDRVDDASRGEIQAKIKEVRQVFELDKSVSPAKLEYPCRVAVGLDHLVEDFKLDALCYYYRGTRDSAYERLGAGLIVGNSLLTARGIPCAGEGDFKNAVAMKIMDALGTGGSFTEFYAMDFEENFVMMGHDGPGHLAISDRKPMLRGLGLYHGKAGKGVSVEFNVKNGPISILSVAEDGRGGLKMVGAEGEAIPGPTFKFGNTNSRLRFEPGPAEFTDSWCAQGAAHHCALGLGHVTAKLEKLAKLKGMEFAKVAG
ncbi:MAG: L-fucose/L-arabinose isomerase family protein [candidate division FCPU426 bacterium]